MIFFIAMRPPDDRRRVRVSGYLLQSLLTSVRFPVSWPLHACKVWIVLQLS